MALLGFLNCWRWDQCWKGFAFPKPVLMTWYVPHAIAEETDWIAILILRPEKNPTIPSSLNMAVVVSNMLWYLISEFDVTNSIWAGWAIKLGFFGFLLNFWVFLDIF